jgi:coenzyme PQQ synthesis protein D (PqqD)
MDQTSPKARREGLIVEELHEETLVYDTERDGARCLNRTAALIWKHCDGETTVAELAHLLEAEWASPVAEGIVWLTLEQLEQYHLLQEPMVQRKERMRPTRRELLRLGIATTMLPLVTSIMVPTAAMAQSGPTGATGPTG